MPIGSSQDPGHQPGLAAITGDLLDEGSGDLDALAVHEALGRIGAHLDTEIGADATLLELTTLEQYAPRALELLASMVRNPRLDPRDFDRADFKRITYEQAWIKYALPARFALAGVKDGMNVFLRGRFWDLGSDGETILIQDGQLRRGTLGSREAVHCAWIS